MFIGDFKSILLPPFVLNNVRAHLKAILAYFWILTTLSEPVTILWRCLTAIQLLNLSERISLSLERFLMLLVNVWYIEACDSCLLRVHWDGPFKRWTDLLIQWCRHDWLLLLWSYFYDSGIVFLATVACYVVVFTDYVELLGSNSSQV